MAGVSMEQGKKKYSKLKITFCRILYLAYFCVWYKTFVKISQTSNNTFFAKTSNNDIRNKSKVCQCVDCSDDLCQGLWKGVSYRGQAGDPRVKRIHVVVSHCQADLFWISDFIHGYDIASIDIVTKCGQPVKGAPSMANIQSLPNVGRCDHSYLNFIITALDSKLSSEDVTNSIILFLKDDISMQNQHQHGKWNDLESMIQIASSSNGFACGVIPGKIELKGTVYDLSVYHETEYLLTYSREEYTSVKHSYKDDSIPFKSSFKNLKCFYDYISGATPSPIPDVVPVCYGGVFAVSVSNIQKVDKLVWRNAESVLQRGNNIEEGHYMERLWAILLATPLSPPQIEQLLGHAVLLRPARFRGSHRGCLLHPTAEIPGSKPQ